MQEKSKENQTINVEKQTLIEIYNLLYSVNVKAEDVKKIALVEQIIEELLNAKIVE